MITRSQRGMTDDELWDEYIRLLVAANDESVDLRQHQDAVCTLRAWTKGVHAATGKCFNGDYYYIDQGIDRPMCVGQFLDWECKHEQADRNAS